SRRAFRSGFAVLVDNRGPAGRDAANMAAKPLISRDAAGRSPGKVEGGIRGFWPSATAPYSSPRCGALVLVVAGFPRGAGALRLPGLRLLRLSIPRPAARRGIQADIPTRTGSPT